MDGDYKYEYPLRTNTGTDRMDLYKRGYFIVEAKQTRIKASKKADANQTDLLGAPDEPEAQSRTSRGVGRAHAQCPPAGRKLCPLPAFGP